MAFLCMGFGDSVTTFVGKAKAAFSLGNFEAQLISFSAFIMFGVLSIPMGIFQARTSKKLTLLIGLFLEFAGTATVLFFGLKSYPVLLASVFLLGAGAAILQVSGNPFMRDVSSKGAFSSNLSLAQFIKATGSNIAPILFLILAYFELSNSDSNSDWIVLFSIFAAMIALTICSVSALKVREEKTDEPASVKSCFEILKNPKIAAAVAGIFLYVGAENCIANGTPIYFTESFGVPSGMATRYVSYFYFSIMGSRLIGAAILRKISPRSFLVASAAISIAGFFLLFSGYQAAATLSIFVIGFGFANIFPLIFSISIDATPEKTNEISGLMVTAIIGAAFLPPLMGALADFLGVLAGFAIPAIATLYIFSLAIYMSVKKA